YTPAEIDGIRAEIAEIKEQSGLSWADLARESGMPAGTIQPFTKSNYTGDNQKIAEKAKIWLMSRADKQQASRKLRRSPEFQKTPTASAFLETLMYAHTSPEIAVISGSPGTGKTCTAEHYAATSSNVYMTTMQPCTATVNTMLNAIAEAMKLNERSQGKLSGAIGAKVRGAGALIIVDEAQHLATAALEQLRSLFDIYKVGIVLIGNEEVYSRLEGGARKATFAQLYSRIGMRTNKSKPAAKDVCMLLDAWDVPADARTLLKTIAQKPGGLRTIDRTLKLVHVLAAGKNEPITERLIKGAYERLSSNGEGA
ncbi:MAG: hypothetical protein COW30_02435, partial [Rhodospirillales bacterium CG15_BIG_FIL_POST_REV_8_21_14_020_66_15]